MPLLDAGGSGEGRQPASVAPVQRPEDLKKLNSTAIVPTNSDLYLVGLAGSV